MDLKASSYLGLFNLVNFFSATVADLDIRALTFNAALPGHKFLLIPGVSLQDCWTNCEIRSSCRSVNYRRQGHLCELNSAGDSTILHHKVAGWVFYKKQNINTEVPCGSTFCGDMEVCDRKTGTCTKECGPLKQKADQYAKGKMVSVGDKGCNNGLSPSAGGDVMQTCNKGDYRPSVTIQTSYEVLDNGVWVKRPCGPGTAFSVDTCDCSINLK